ncbi:hypothetical protein AAVH_17908 [Aphelenchoides avenae]|nr:hypothetical protein AAVH_17908 [Aphelenchus avenae]
MGGLSPSAKLEIFDLLGPEYLYQLNGAENIYLIHLTDYGFPGMDLKRHSTSDGYDFAVKSSLYMLLEDEYDETAMPFGTVTLSPLKDGFLRHLSALEGDVAFVDVATKWTVPLMIDHFLNHQDTPFSFSSLTITLCGPYKWPSINVTHGACVQCSRRSLRKDALHTGEDVYHFDVSHSDRRMSISVTYGAEPVWNGRCWQYCMNRLNVARIRLEFCVASSWKVLPSPKMRTGNHAGTDICCDIFGFLVRPDVEACRLVCVAWNACYATSLRTLPLHHLLQVIEPNESGPIEMIVDPTTVMSYIKNSHVRLLKLDFDLGLVSDVLNAMEKARSSDETWSTSEDSSKEFLERLDDILKPAHYRVQAMRYGENVENIRTLFSRILLRQRGFRLQLQWPYRYGNDALSAVVRDSWTDFVLRSGASSISVVYTDDMRESNERPFSAHQIIQRLLEEESDECMVREVELVGLKPGLLSFRRESGALIAEEVDKGHVVFPPVSYGSRPLLLRMFRLYGSARTLTLVTGMDGVALMSMRLIRGKPTMQEIRVNAEKGDRANIFFVYKPY